MYDALTVIELDELSDVLCYAVYDVKHYGPAPMPELLTEMQELSNEVWRVRCARSGIRCCNMYQDMTA